MKAKHALETFGVTVGESRCFDIGIRGGCGVNCPAFLDGECDEPQEISKQEVIDEHGEKADEVLELYDCYNK